MYHKYKLERLGKWKDFMETVKELLNLNQPYQHQLTLNIFDKFDHQSPCLSSIPQKQKSFKQNNFLSNKNSVYLKPGDWLIKERK